MDMKFNGTKSNVLTNDEVQGQWHIHEVQLHVQASKGDHDCKGEPYICYHTRGGQGKPECTICQGHGMDNVILLCILYGVEVVSINKGSVDQLQTIQNKLGHQLLGLSDQCPKEMVEGKLDWSMIEKEVPKRKLMVNNYWIWYIYEEISYSSNQLSWRMFNSSG